MFKKVKILILCFLMLVGQGLILAQGIVENFAVSEIDGKVYLTWTITTGNTCDGTKIMRSSDNMNFEVIGEITGVCGSTETATNYDFIDEDPIADQMSYYKLELGGFGESYTRSIEVINAENFLRIIPHPVIDWSFIYFNNDLYSQHFLMIYDTRGNMIYSETTTSDFFELQPGNIKPGIYFFYIYDQFENKIRVSSQLVIL